MKEEKQQPLHDGNPKRKATAYARKKFTQRTAYFILLLLSYTLGYFSASSSKSPHSPTPIIAQNMLAANATATAGDLDHYRFTTQCADPVPSKLVRQTILQRVFDGTSPYDKFPPAHISPLLLPQKIHGWGSYGAVFENLVRKVQPETIIEVGTFLGASAIHMAELASGLGLKTQIVCVDDFRGWPEFRNEVKDVGMLNGDVLLLYQFMQNVVSANATESVVFVPFSTGVTLDMLCKWGVFGDLIEVDAGHDFHSAWIDINRAYKILRPGGVIFGHDYFNVVDKKGVKRAVDLFARLNNLQVHVDGQHWVLDSA